jgi:hypothetical protein
MVLTKNFNDLVQNRAASDPEFAAALAREGTGSTSAPLTMREALRLIWRAAKYPILGNGDVQLAQLADAEALERAGTAVLAPDDAPEFAVWIAALRSPKLAESEREEIISAIYDLFEPDEA